MSGFADLVPRALPALASVNASATEGRTWLWEFEDIVDDDGTAIDLTTGATGTCKIVTDLGGTVVATPTFTGGSGSFTLGLDESVTAGLANGNKRRACRWDLVVVKGGDSVQFWGALDSSFMIYPEA